jgi:hypothetical protein
MTLSINPTFRLKATAGQSAPINEVGAHETLAGGTFSLVDRGSGDVAWQFSGTGDTRAVIGSAYTVTQSSGLTIAITLRVVTQPTVDFTRYFMYTDAAAVNNGMRLGHSGNPGGIRVVSTDFSSTNVTLPIGPSTAADVTYVARLGTTEDCWTTTASRSGTAPNASISSGSFGTVTLTDVLIRAAASDVIQVKDIAIFPGLLTDTECANLADNFRATIDSDTTAPTLSSAVVANATPTVVTLTMSEAMDSAFVPAASAFAVSGHTVSSVSISGSTISLTCSTAFVNGEAARTVSYTQPGTNNARDLAGNLLANFSAQAITNNVAATDTTAPTATGAVVANATPTFVDITMSEAMDTGFTPGASAVTVSGHTVSSLAWASATVLRATVSAAFVNGEAARTAAYTQPGTNNARDAAGNLLANFTGLAITNNVAATDTTKPTFVSAQVANAAPSDIVITMSETLAAFTPATSAWSVSGGKTVTGVARSGATVTLTCSAPYAYGDTITVTYTKPGSNALQDAAGNQTDNFGPSSVTNNIAAPAGFTIPLVNGANIARVSLTGLTVAVTDYATLAPVKVFTSKTSDTSGNCVIADALLVAGSWYVATVRDSAGVLGVDKFQAA